MGNENNGSASNAPDTDTYAHRLYLSDFLRELAIGYATLKRLLDIRRPLDENGQGTLVAITTCGDGNYYDDILATILTKSLNIEP